MADNNKPVNRSDFRNTTPSKRSRVNQDKSPYNQDNGLFKRLTKLFSGPIVNRRQQNYKSERRRRLDKYNFQSAQGQQFKKSSYNPFDFVHSQSMANQNRAERYVDFEQMEYCLHGDTKIAVPGGYKTIKELAEEYGTTEEFIVYAYDHTKKQIVPAFGKQARKTTTDHSWKVIFENGQEIIGTANHRLMMRDGTYRTIDQLSVGDSLMPFYRKDLSNGQKDQGDGYRWIHTMHQDTERKKGWIAEHTLIAEWVAGRKVGQDEVVHHLNFTKHDNRPQNLLIMNSKEHLQYHQDIVNEQRKNTKWWDTFRKNHSEWMKINNPAERKDINFEIILSLCDQYGYNQKNICRMLDTDPNTIKRKLKTKGFDSFEMFAKTYKPGWKNDGCNNKGAKNPRHDHSLTFGNICNAYKKGMTNKEIADSLSTTPVKISNRIKQNGYKNFTDFANNHINHKVSKIEYYGFIDLYDLTVDGYKNFATDSVISHNTAEINCLTIDTKVSTLNGFKTIEQLLKDYPNGENFEIWSWDHEKCQYTIGNAHHVRKTGTKKILELVFDNDKTLKCTYDHRILLKDGSYIQASQLKPGDALMSFDFKINSAGYMNLRTKNFGKYKQVHRYIFEDIFEQEIGNTHVQHINEDKMDNETSNLRLLSAEEHMCLHGVSSITNERRGETLKTNWASFSAEEKEHQLRGVREWSSSEEGKSFMSERQSFINAERWNNDKEYARKMAQIFSNHAKKLWQDPEWSKWKKQHHSRTMILKYKNDPLYKEKIARQKHENGRYINVISTENILVEGMRYESLADLARNFDFGDRQFIKNEYKVQFLNRRLREAGFNGWKDYKNRYSYSNHKVKEVRFLDVEEDVYDLTVDHFENFCLESGIIVSNSALDIYADEMTTSNSLEKVLTIDCPNEEIKNILHSLYYDILNIEFNLFGWSRTMCKFGDFFLYLDIDERDGIRNAIGIPPYEVERIEGQDEKNPNYVQFQWNSGGMTFENWQMGHFRVLGNDKYAPYGTSVLEGARRIVRQLTLLEDAMMAYRIVRSAERRVFYIDVGNVAPSDVEQFMQKAMTALKRNQIVDEKTGRVDLRYNPLSIEEDYFIPVRGQQSTKIESLAGGQYTGDIEDVKYLRDKLFSAIKIPQSYLSRGEGGQEDKTTLAQKDIRFARTIQRLQRSIISELEKIGVIHLFILGYRNEDLIKFKLRLNNPSKIAELQELETWKTKFEVASAATEGYFSRRWVAKKIFGLSDEEFLRNQREMFFDFKFKAAVEKAGSEQEAAAGDADAFGGGMDVGDTGAGGAEGGPGIDLGALTSEPEDGAAPAETPAETPAGGDEAGPLLAAPGKRDDKLTTTPASRGKLYMPVKYHGGDSRPAGARTRSYQSKFSKELGGGSMRNVMGSGAQELFGLGNGIYEQYESSYSEEMLSEAHKKQDNNIVEQKILSNNDNLKQLISSLEKKNARNKENSED